MDIKEWKWNRVIHNHGDIPVTTLEGPDVLCRYWDTGGITGNNDAAKIITAPNMIEALRKIYSEIENKYPEELDIGKLKHWIEEVLKKATGSPW